MPKNSPLPTSAPRSIEEAWKSGDEIATIRAVVDKYARVLDMTDAGRDIKPLASGMFEAIDRLKELEEVASRDTRETPLDNVLRMASGA